MLALIPVLIAVTLWGGSAALAQTLDQHSFGFKFAGSTAVDIVQCGVVPLATIPVNTTVNYGGVPPYTILSFEAGGVSDRQDGGVNGSYIPWQVRHNPGARLWLTIIDSNGDYAGFPTHYITVLAGNSNACMRTLPDNLPKINANVSEAKLETCQEWGMTITGGTPPYSVQIVAEDSPVYTNTSEPDTVSDRFTYANRADPGRYMIVAVSDATGQFGYSSRPVLTTGSTNTSCPGINSSWRRASVVEAEIEAAKEAEKQREEAQQRTTIIAVVVSIVGFILLCVLSFFVWRRVVAARAGVRKGQPGFDMEPVAAFFPPPAQEQQQMDTQTQMSQMHGEPPITPFMSSHSSQQLTRHISSRSGVMSPGSSYSQRDELPPLPDFDPYMLVGSSAGSTPANRKAAEAAAERRAALTRDQSISSHSYGPSTAGPGTYNFSVQHSISGGSSSGLRRGPSSVGGSGMSQSAPSVVGTDDDGAIIVQHRDAGMQPIVELPPSYDPGSYRRQSSMPGASQYPLEKRQ